jgi:hypothetical protein
MLYTGEKPTTKQFIIRHLREFVSSIPVCLGYLWIGIDKRKQGCHDKLSVTVVIKKQ